MSVTEKQNRYCFVNPEGGTVAIDLHVDTDLAAGGDFKLYNSSRDQVLDQVKLSAENGSHELKRFKVEAKYLSGTVLVWKILLCSKNIKTYEGRIDIKVLQDGGACRFTLPATYKPENIPPCSINNPASISGSLVFMPKNPG